MLLLLQSTIIFLLLIFKFYKIPFNMTF